MSSDRKVTRSVYENAKGIVEQKGKWANAAANKTDPSIYEEAAKPSYKYLEENEDNPSKPYSWTEYGEEYAQSNGFRFESPSR